MKSEDFEKLIDKEKYQVFVFACPACMPFTFAVHPWFVVNKKSVISIWEIKYYRNSNDKTYLHKNNQGPYQGIEIIPYLRKFIYKSRLIGYVEGDENSFIKRISDFIENSKENYPYLGEYSLTGPNSNTYVEWVLSNFPDSEIKLPWNSFGKNYKK